MAKYGGSIYVTDEVRGWTVTMHGPHHRTQSVKKGKAQAIEAAHELKKLQEHNERRIGYKKSVYRLFVEGEEILDDDALSLLAEPEAPVEPVMDSEPPVTESNEVPESTPEEPAVDDPTVVFNGIAFEGDKLKISLSNPTEEDIQVWRSIDGKDGTRKLKAGVDDKWTYKATEESLVIFAETDSSGAVIYSSN